MKLNAVVKVALYSFLFLFIFLSIFKKYLEAHKLV